MVKIVLRCKSIKIKKKKHFEHLPSSQNSEFTSIFFSITFIVIFKTFRLEIGQLRLKNKYNYKQT